jgi:hypothetical protein
MEKQERKQPNNIKRWRRRNKLYTEAQAALDPARTVVTASGSGPVATAAMPCGVRPASASSARPTSATKLLLEQRVLKDARRSDGCSPSATRCGEVRCGASSASAPDDWGFAELASLQSAYFRVEPTHAFFWVEVAKMVPGRTAGECFARVHDRHASWEERCLLRGGKRRAEPEAPSQSSHSRKPMTEATSRTLERQQRVQAQMQRISGSVDASDALMRRYPELADAMRARKDADRYISSFVNTWKLSSLAPPPVRGGGVKAPAQLSDAVAAIMQWGSLEEESWVMGNDGSECDDM